MDDKPMKVNFVDDIVYNSRLDCEIVYTLPQCPKCKNYPTYDLNPCPYCGQKLIYPAKKQDVF